MCENFVNDFNPFELGAWEDCEYHGLLSFNLTFRGSLITPDVARCVIHSTLQFQEFALNSALSSVQVERARERSSPAFGWPKTTMKPSRREGWLGGAAAEI